MCYVQHVYHSCGHWGADQVSDRCVRAVGNELPCRDTENLGTKNHPDKCSHCQHPDHPRVALVSEAARKVIRVQDARKTQLWHNRKRSPPKRRTGPQLLHDFQEARSRRGPDEPTRFPKRLSPIQRLLQHEGVYSKSSAELRRLRLIFRGLQGQIRVMAKYDMAAYRMLEEKKSRVLKDSWRIRAKLYTCEKLIEEALNDLLGTLTLGPVDLRGQLAVELQASGTSVSDN